MIMKRKEEIEKVIPNEELFIDEEVINNSELKCYKEFNLSYGIFCDVSNDEATRVSNGQRAAIIVANDFDFTRDEIKGKKNEYVNFSRDMLYEAAIKPYNNPIAMMYLIKALYGQTNIAYSQTLEHQGINLNRGNEWVDHLERTTDNKPLKAYALTLRSYEYIINGVHIGMSIEDRIHKAEKDLIYATKWDPQNYFAYFALGLLYMDTYNSKYNVEKALENFEKVVSFENSKAAIDDYLDISEKRRFMSAAYKKISELS